MVPICCYFNIALKVVKFKEEEVIVRAESSAAFLASSPLKTLKATLPGVPPPPKASSTSGWELFPTKSNRRPRVSKPAPRRYT